jgi:alkanesulfonate monooxygenase SsuD/methylene tetrahydromethanopterin reductase-like flavin-dependent oxidoreductase (luciferase family)
MAKLCGALRRKCARPTYKPRFRETLGLAVAAEQLGADGAHFRAHHFACQLASPFPLLAAVGARASGSRRSLAAGLAGLFQVTGSW